MRYQVKPPKKDTILSRREMYNYCREFPRDQQAKEFYMKMFSGLDRSIVGIYVPRYWGYVMPWASLNPRDVRQRQYVMPSFIWNRVDYSMVEWFKTNMCYEEKY